MFLDIIETLEKKGIYEKLGYTKSKYKADIFPLHKLRNAVAHQRSIITRKDTVDNLWKLIDMMADVLFRLRQTHEIPV